MNTNVKHVGIVFDEADWEAVQRQYTVYRVAGLLSGEVNELGEVIGGSIRDLEEYRGLWASDHPVDEKEPATEERLVAAGMVRREYGGGRRWLLALGEPDNHERTLCWHPGPNAVFRWSFGDRDEDAAGIDAPNTMGTFYQLRKLLMGPPTGPEVEAERVEDPA